MTFRPGKKPQGLMRMFHEDTLEKNDKLAVMLMSRWPTSHIPEIYSIFGKEGLVKFLDIFAGMTIRVPSKKALEETVRDHTLYDQYNDMKIPVKELANAYDIPVSTVYYIIKKMENLYGESTFGYTGEEESVNNDRQP